MARNSLRQRLVRLVTTIAVGGSAFQLSGCDPNVRSTLLTGLETTTQALSTSIITAFFLTLEEDTVNANGLTTT
ncbi:MAG: hypothetical protein ACPGXK_15450 [Phycisphaerae bacterium]